ncbi:alpha/beta hydrolase [Desnuesiella massiliensis]|uniref:alpha/beta hydrolase n=1 Tax=Desnuesiella massiliensis TaxID=1650662 RepID=UPI000AA3319A|nr:alpha/beta hydrolase [Desnuesiella massiliensis]
MKFIRERSEFMRTNKFKIRMRDGQELHIYKWEPEDAIEIKGIIQLVHGSCEHSARYADFANFITEKGYVVYSNDHRGHGLSANSSEDFGFFGENNGWQAMVEDLNELTKLIRKDYAEEKITLLGHSMGSFLARHYAIEYGSSINGLIATGTAHNPRMLLQLGKSLAEREIKNRGPKHRSNFLNKLSYESFNNKFRPIRTKQDWLTRDEKIVDKFIEDEFCGFVFTTSGFRDMFNGLLYITDIRNIVKTPKNLPILLLSGKDDPVGANGRMVNKAFNHYKRAGVENVNMKLYDGMRHEILNELGKEEVYNDILNWIEGI